MAKTDIGPKISVEGESEYRKQMKNIIQQQKEYSSEMTLVTAQLGKNATAQERATSVTATLKKQIQATESALNAQNSMLKKAVETYGEADAKTSAYRTAINKTNAELVTLKSRLSDAENGLGEFAEKAESSGDSMAKSVTAGTLAAKGFETVGKVLLDAGKQVVQAGVSYNAQLEQYQVALTNMLGSSEAAQEALEAIKQDAARTPFDTAGLVKANELLISTGVDASSARTTIMALGDAVSATGGGNDELSRMAQNLQQIQNAGKATSADIKQFAYAGIDIYGILADYTGKSTAEVQKMTVTYDLLTAALENAASEGGRYYNSMATQSDTLNGKMSTLKDNATQLAGLMTADLTDGIKMVVGNLNDMAVAAAEAYKKDGWVGLATEIASLNPLIAGVINEMSALGSGLSSIAQSAIGVLDQWSYKLNKLLGKDAYAGYNSYDEYRADQTHTSNKNRRRQNAIKGVGISNTSWSDRQKAASGGDSTGSETSTATQKAASKTAQKAAADQKKLAASVTDTSTKLLEGTGNIVGAIKQVTETADNTYKVYDGTTGKLKGTTTETAQTITKTWTEMVDGVEKNFKQVDTLLDGVVQTTKKTSEDVAAPTKKSVGSKTEVVAGPEDALGSMQRTTQSTKELSQVFDAETGQMKESVTSATDVITECYTRIVNGQRQAVEQTKTVVNGVVTDINEKVSDLNETKTSVDTKTEQIYGQEGVLGAVTRTTQSTQNVTKVFDEATGEMKDSVTSMEQVVTDSYVAIIDGQKKLVERTTTYVDGVVDHTDEKITALNDEITGVQGAVGGFTKFILDLDTKIGGLETVANNLSNSPLKNWFSDLSKGYRASDSFFDNIDLFGLAGSALSGGISGFKLTGSWWGAAAGAIVGAAGNLLGTAVSMDSESWGADLVSGLASGMQSGIKWVVEAATKVGDTIASFLHFSRPDIGPLREYEKWMPDMISGMASGILDNVDQLKSAAAELSGTLKMQLQYDVGKSNAAMSAAYTNRRISMGGVNISIYPKEGQDAEEIAQYTIERLQMMIDTEAAAHGEVPVF